MKNFSHVSKICGYLLVISVIAFAAPCSTYSQTLQSGCLANLTKSNGFKGLVLGTNPKTLRADELSFLDDNPAADADGCFSLAYKDDSLFNIGNGLLLDMVGMRTFRNQIVNIYLFFKREDGPQVLKSLMANYGRYTNSPGDFMYDWKTGPVTLLLRYEVATDLGVAIFTSNQLVNKIAQARHNSDTQTLAASNLTGRTL